MFAWLWCSFHLEFKCRSLLKNCLVHAYWIAHSINHTIVNNVKLFRLELSSQRTSNFDTACAHNLNLNSALSQFWRFRTLKCRRNIHAQSLFAGCRQAFKFVGKAASWDTVCENQCWEKSIFGWEAQDHCSSNSCPHKECQSGWLCGMCIKALTYW